VAAGVLALFASNQLRALCNFCWRRTIRAGGKDQPAQTTLVLCENGA